jgi:hypothetical protein
MPVPDPRRLPKCASWAIMPRDASDLMTEPGQPGQLFALLNEFVVLLLGALMTLLALTGRFALPRRPAWVAVGVFLIYWGARTWMRPAPSALRQLHANLRGGSLALVGVLMLVMAWLPARYAAFLLGAAGTLLVARGIAGAALLVRKP